MSQKVRVTLIVELHGDSRDGICFVDELFEMLEREFREDYREAYGNRGPDEDNNKWWEVRKVSHNVERIDEFTDNKDVYIMDCSNQNKEENMEKIEVKSFYIYKDGGYRMTGRWYGHKIDFETYPGDAPELIIDGENVAWDKLIELFPVVEFDGENKIDNNERFYRRFSAIQRLTDEIMMAIETIEQPKPY